MESNNLIFDIEGYRLVQTCEACPEQYDVFNNNGQRCAYIRLRYGDFRAEVPYCLGRIVYYSKLGGLGVGNFTDELTRNTHLTNAIKAINEYYSNPIEEMVETNEHHLQFPIVNSIGSLSDTEKFHINSNLSKEAADELAKIAEGIYTTTIGMIRSLCENLIEISINSIIEKGENNDGNDR